MKSSSIRIMQRVISLILLSMCLSVASAQSTLSIEITNLRNNLGQISLELLDKKQRVVKKVVVGIENSTTLIVIDSLSNTKYAIRYIHDENSNGELDTNWLGIPQEGYGFSNDAYGTFGPKDFEEWLFEMDGDMKIVFKTKY